MKPNQTRPNQTDADTTLTEPHLASSRRRAVTSPQSGTRPRDAPIHPSPRVAAASSDARATSRALESSTAARRVDRAPRARARRDATRRATRVTTRSTIRTTNRREARATRRETPTRRAMAPNDGERMAFALKIARGHVVEVTKTNGRDDRGGVRGDDEERRRGDDQVRMDETRGGGERAGAEEQTDRNDGDRDG